MPQSAAAWPRPMYPRRGESDDPAWTIDKVAGQIGAIRDRSDAVSFPVLPAGHDDHIAFSFDTGYRKSQGLKTKWK